VVSGPRAKRDVNENRSARAYQDVCSDGNLSIEEMFEEAKKRGIDLISTPDHNEADKINGFSEIVSL
jgi:hypothetical protein